MILESMIRDDSRLTLDCAKATLFRGSIIDIPDNCWNLAEVQNAIRLGFCRLVGEPPAAAVALAAQPREPNVRLRNNYRTILSFECLKANGICSVPPGGVISVPQSKLAEMELANAISWGMLVDESSTAAPMAPPARGEPVRLEELRANDIIDTTAREADIIETTPAEYRNTNNNSRPASQGARAVGRIGDTMLAENDLTRPSEIPESVLNPDRAPRRQARQAQAPAPQAEAPAAPPAAPAKPAMSADDVFSFLDIFDGDAPAAPETKTDGSL